MQEENLKSGAAVHHQPWDVRRSMVIEGTSYDYWSLRAFEAATPNADLARLPYCVRILLENLLRHYDGDTVTTEAVLGVAGVPGVRPPDEVAYHPSRVVMPDSSGVPLLVDLAAMRDALAARGEDPELVNPVVPVQMVVDHSAVTHFAGTDDALERNLDLEFSLNRERYGLIRWAQKAFKGFRVVPPGSGILHQINLEHLAQVVTVRADGERRELFPDSLVGMDSHTPMVNGLGLFGWGVGGVEAASAILGEPITMRVPKVVGCRVTGKLGWGVTATDVVLTVTQRMRAHGVLGAFVEFFGPGLDGLTVADRATIANMTPEYGATMGYFPIDDQTIAYLKTSGRSAAHCRRVEAYAREQRLWRSEEPVFEEVVELNLAEVERCVAGPRRPQDRVAISHVPASFREVFTDGVTGTEQGGARSLRNGDVVIASITSCTNTSNPSVMIGAGLLARNAVAAGLKVKPWVKSSLSPGSRRVGEYLEKAGLQQALDALGFQVVGYGCMTCMGSSGPLEESLQRQIENHQLAVAAVVSANRNFEARVHLQARANYLASPPLVIAYALAGSVLVDLTKEPLGTGRDSKPVYLADLWPSDEEIASIAAQVIEPELFTLGYARLDEGPANWEQLVVGAGSNYDWSASSTYIQPPPYVAGALPSGGLHGARALVMLGDDVTTDHIAPVGTTAADSQVGLYLRARGVELAEFNTLSSRRANPHVVARTAFSNVQLRNELVPGKEGEYTRHQPDGETLPIYVAAERYREEGVPLIVVAGKNYGAGSSRDTAAKGVRLLGVQAVIAESYERIHRSNLVCLGVLPLEFMNGENRKSLGVAGTDSFDLLCDLADLQPRGEVQLRVRHTDGSQRLVPLRVRIDTARELQWYRHGGVMPYVLTKLAGAHHG